MPLGGSPKWKLYNAEGEYIAACRYVEDALMLMAFNGDDSTIKFDHRTLVWTEGKEEIRASESIDRAVAIVDERMGAHARQVKEKQDAAMARWAARTPVRS